MDVGRLLYYPSPATKIIAALQRSRLTHQRSDFSRPVFRAPNAGLEIETRPMTELERSSEVSTTQLHAAVSRRTSLSHHPSAGRSSLMELPHSASSFRKDRRTDPLNCTLQYQVQGCLFQSDVHLFNARLRFPAFCGIRVLLLKVQVYYCIYLMHD